MCNSVRYLDLDHQSPAQLAELVGGQGNIAWWIIARTTWADVYAQSIWKRRFNKQVSVGDEALIQWSGRHSGKKRMAKISLGRTGCGLKKASMTTLRIYDCRDKVLALDLRDLIDLLAPHSLEACWIVSPVTLVDVRLGRSHDEFMIVGPGQLADDTLEQLAASRSIVRGNSLSEAAHATHQVIWGQFVATLPQQEDPWVIIRAIDSTFYEVTSGDDAVLDAIRSAYEDVRVATGPITSIPIE
jgi:hypothetical protein